MRATFAGGCFWGMEKHFRHNFKSSIRDVQVGYIGGIVIDPTYKMVCTGTTGHAEALTFTYLPEETSYRSLLDFFWRIHDPTTLNAQGADIGSQYRSAVFFHNEEQEKDAKAAITELQESGKFTKNIVTQIVPESTFYPAEDHHQNYLEKNPDGMPKDTFDILQNSQVTAIIGQGGKYTSLIFYVAYKDFLLYLYE